MRLSDIDITTFTELFLEQYELNRLREEGYAIDIYFDSDEIFKLIQGYWAINNNTVKTSLLEDDFLLRCLAYFGKLQNLKIFKPHKVEIGNYLKREEDFPLHEIPNKVISELLQSFELVDIKKYNLSDKIHINYLSSLIPKSLSFFKYYYILDEPNWPDRAERIFRGESPLFKDDEFDYPVEKLIEGEIFEKIYGQLSDRRKNRSINNFRDALSLAMLHHRKSLFKTTKHIPAFLISADTFDYVFSNESLAEQFYIEIDSKSFNTVHKAELFIIDAVFSNQEITNKFFTKLNELIKKRNLLKDFKNDEPFIKSLNKDIDEFYKLEFFQVLRDILNNTNFDFESSIRKLYEFQKSMNNTEFIEKLEEHKQSLIAQIQSNTDEFEILEKIWITVEKIKPVKINIISDIFRETGITRFSPSIKIGSKLRQLWNSITTDREINEIPYNIKAEIVITIFKGINQKNYDSLAIGCCILWIFDQYDTINFVLDKLNFEYGNNLTLALLHASSLCNNNDQNKRISVKKIIDCIHIKIGNDKTKWRYQHLMGLSYVNFRIWESEEMPLHPIIDVQKNKFSSIFYAYALEAISNAKLAFRILEDIKNTDSIRMDYRNIKYYYSLNIYIYYVTRTGTPKEFLSKQFENRVIIFEGTDSTSYWQPTFNHTLASYYARKFYLEKNPVEKNKYITKAADQYNIFITSTTVANKRFEALNHFIESHIPKH